MARRTPNAKQEVSTEQVEPEQEVEQVTSEQSEPKAKRAQRVRPPVDVATDVFDKAFGAVVEAIDPTTGTIPVAPLSALVDAKRDLPAGNAGPAIIADVVAKRTEAAFDEGDMTAARYIPQVVVALNAAAAERTPSTGTTKDVDPVDVAIRFVTALDFWTNKALSGLTSEQKDTVGTVVAMVREGDLPNGDGDAFDPTSLMRALMRGSDGTRKRSGGPQRNYAAALQSVRGDLALAGGTVTLRQVGEAIAAQEAADGVTFSAPATSGGALGNALNRGVDGFDVVDRAPGKDGALGTPKTIKVTA